MLFFYWSRLMLSPLCWETWGPEPITSHLTLTSSSQRHPEQSLAPSSWLLECRGDGSTDVAPARSCLHQQGPPNRFLSSSQRDAEEVLGDWLLAPSHAHQSFSMMLKSDQMSSNRGFCRHMPTVKGLGSGCLFALILTVRLCSFLHLLPLFLPHPSISPYTVL